MKKNTKLVIPGLVLALALGGYSLVNAAAKTTAPAATKPAAAASTQTAVKSAQPTPKISQDEASKIALKAHKGAKVTDIKLVVENGKPFYIVKLETAKGGRELKIGGNSGKIFRDKLTAAVKTTK